MNRLDFSKPELLQTRDGREVRIFCTDGIKPYEILGAIKGVDGWCHSCWRVDGRYRMDGTSTNDLVAKPQRVTGWVNVYYPSRPGFAVGDLVHKTIADAQNVALSTCIGQIYIDAEVQS